MFYNGDSEHEAIIRTNVGLCSLIYNPKDALTISLNTDSDLYSAKIDDKLIIRVLHTGKNFDTRIKRYNYKQDVVYKKGHAKYLIPPFGYNLLSIIEKL